MAENGLPSTLPDTTPIYRLIRRTRSLLRSTWVATGLGLTVGLLLATLVGVTITDLVAPLLPALRLVGLLVVIIPATWVFIVGVVRPLFRRLKAGHIARRIEIHIPGIHNRLVSCIDLESRNGERQYSPAFYRRLLVEALERIRHFRARMAVDFHGLRRASVFAFSSLVAFVLAITVFSDRLPQAMARIFHPFADLPPKTGVEYTVEPGTVKVLRGDDISFIARVIKGEPKNLRLELRSDSVKTPLWYDLQKQEGSHWQIALNSANIGTGFDNGFHYRVHGGGTWTVQHDITIVDRPKIVELHTILHYPEYMAMPEPRIGPPQTAEVTGPEESAVEVAVQAEGDVKEGEIQLVEPRIRQVDPKDQVERVWFEDKLPAGATSEGTWQWNLPAHQRSTHTEPVALGTHGHWFQNSSVAFQVQPGENLFAYVYIVPENKPDAIMLQWHDGTSWEHRALWGVDKIKMGSTNSPGRRRIGPLPEVGQWVRLEVPAELIGLQGKAIRGMAFTLSGGQCFWHRAGAVEVERQLLVPVSRFAMHGAESNLWSGRFPLHGSGLYRVELRNDMGYANKTMKEAKYIAIPDNPPQIVLERPGTDLVLSTPGKVPLVIAAYDDFGLADVSLAIQRGDKEPFQNQTVKRYDRPRRSDNLVASLDLADMKVKIGEFVRYRAEARDRKGQVTKTQDYVIRVAVDQNAADQQLLAFEKSQDPFREKLVTLIGQQAKVRDAVEKLAVKYAPLNKAIKEAVAKAEATAPKTDPAQKAQPTTPPLKLDPASEKALQELRKELAELAKQEQQNVQLGQQVAADLNRLADQGSKLQMLPKQVVEELQALPQLFQQLGLQPLQDIAAQMNQGADAKQAANPKVPELKQKSDRLQKELEAMQARMKALDEAQKKLSDNANDAVAKLQQEMLKEKGSLTARDLEDLKDFIAALRKELQEGEKNQENLLRNTDKAPEKDLPDLEKKQEDLDKNLDNTLDKTKELQASEKMKRMKRQRKPNFPASPYDPDTDEKMVRPMEEDPDEPDPAKKDAKDAAKDPAKDAKDKKADKNADDDDEELFMPALGGPKPKVDPRFAKKQRPVDRKAQKGDKTAEEHRHDMEVHQSDQLHAVNQAQESLHSDEQTLDQMLQQLRQAMRGGNHPHQPGQSEQPEESDEQNLMQMLKSQALQHAMAMAQRMQGLKNGSHGKQGKPHPPHGQATVGNLQGSPPLGAPLEGELGKLDLNTRNALMNMQPRLREELLQSMREEGPEGYRKFIQDYFKRLTEVKTTK